jgi:hypothetical protein
MRTALDILDRDFLAGHGGDHCRAHDRRFGRQRVKRGDLARQAGDAEAVAAVRRQLQAEQAVVERQVFLERRAGADIAVEFEQTLGFFSQAQLRSRAQHAAGFDAAQQRFADLDTAGKPRAGQRRRHQDAGARVGGAADDLEGCAGSGIDFAHLQAVGLRVRLGLEDAAHHHAARQLGAQRFDLAFKPCEIEFFGQGRGVDRGIDPFA